MPEDYKPTLVEIVSEMTRDIGRGIGNLGRRISNSVKSKKASANESVQGLGQRLPEYSRTAREIASDITGEIRTSLSESYHNVNEFMKGFVHDGLEVLIFPYIMPSAHRLDTLEWAQEWRGFSEKSHGWLCNGQHYQGGSYGGCGTRPRPDVNQSGGIFGTLTGLGLTIAEGIGYWYMARKGYPNVLVLALPLATNAASGLYEYGATIRQRLIERHSQRI